MSQPQQYPHARNLAQPHYAPPPKRRRVWIWVLLAIILTPIMFFVACTAMISGAAKSIDDARKGGTVNLGQTFTYKSGLSLTVTVPKAYVSKNQFVVPKGEVAYESTVTITNGTGKAVGASLITMNATLAGAPAQRLTDEAAFPTQDIAPGGSLGVPFRFKTQAGTKGALQIAVTDTFNEPVFFNGQIS